MRRLRRAPATAHGSPASVRKVSRWGGVEIAEQASDRPVKTSKSTYIFSRSIKTVAGQCSQALLTDHEFAAGSENERDMLSALQRKRRRRQARHGDIDRWQPSLARSPSTSLLPEGKSIEQSFMAAAGASSTTYARPNLPRCGEYCAWCPWGRDPALCCSPSTTSGGSSENTLKKAERRGVDLAVLVERRDQRDRPLHHDPTEQLVSVVRRSQVRAEGDADI